MNKKDRKPIYFIILLVVLFAIAFVFTRGRRKNTDYSEISDDSAASSLNRNGNEETSSAELTPEEALEALDPTVEIKEPLEVEIISPEEKSFLPGQARYYKAEITNFPKNASGRCEWKFFLNENNEEILYEEMETNIARESCGFTSTFIKNVGKLRVEVTVLIENPTTKEVLTQKTAGRSYVVK